MSTIESLIGNRIHELSAEYVPATYDGLLYKFRAPGYWLEELLSTKKLYFASPATWNDPWDVQTTIDTTCDYETLLAYHRRILPESHRDRADLITKRYMENPELLHLEINNVRQRIFETQGYCSFAGDWKHVLLWSYYAAGHTGVAIGFIPSKDRTIFKSIYPMRYEEHPRNDYFNDPAKSILDLVLVKSSEWNHENEWRASHDKFGAYEYNDHCLHEIIFGVRCDPHYIDYIRNLCYSVGLTSVLFYQALKVTGRYELERSIIPGPKKINGLKPSFQNPEFVTGLIHDFKERMLDLKMSLRGSNIARFNHRGLNVIALWDASINAWSRLEVSTDNSNASDSPTVSFIIHPPTNAPWST